MKIQSEQLLLNTVIPPDLAGHRLDQALSILFKDYSRSRIQTWIRANQVTVNGKLLRPRDKVNTGDKISIAAEITSATTWEPENLPLNIVYEDEALLVVNKSPGQVVHPAAGNYEGTLLNALLHHFPPLAALPRAGIIHRLDKDTSGLLVVAKTLTAHHALIKQMQRRTIKREYEAIVIGVLTAGGTIAAPIGRHSIRRKQMAVVEAGKPAVTHYRVLEKFRAHTRIKVILETGRTHQIRVHMASIHHPLVGDQTYGGRLRLPAGAGLALTDMLRNFKRQALHAVRLGLIHPTSKDSLEWEAPLPEDLVQLITCLREDVNSK